MYSRIKASALLALITLAQATIALKIPYLGEVNETTALYYGIGGTLALNGIVFLSTYKWSTYHHPAALQKKKLELEYAERQRKEQQALEEKKLIEQREENERKKAREAQLKHLEAQQQVAAIHHTYADEMQQLETLHDKEKFYAIIKAKNGNEQYLLEHYFQKLTHDIHTLRFCETNILDGAEKQGHQQLLEVLEKIRRTFNTALSDIYKHEQETAKKFKLQQEAIQRIVQKEKLELEELESRIAANKSKTHKNNSLPQIKEDLHHVKNLVLSIAQISSETQHMQGKLYNQQVDQINNFLQKFRTDIDASIKDTAQKKALERELAEIKNLLEQIQKAKNVIVYPTATPAVPATCGASTGSSAGNPPPSFVNFPDSNAKPSAPPVD
jgi:hypothetical protein